MGCAAFTPSLVGLAGELEGEPFHLVASYNQSGDSRRALHEIFQNGLPVTAGNVSATLSARHPDVTGITYVPYYLVFDQHGELAYHHQGGPYHGGDDTAVLERVRSMIAKLPAVYVGKEPYSSERRLADAISKGTRLGSSLPQLAKAVEARPQDEELKRLVEYVEHHAGRALRRFETRAATDPKGAIQELTELARAYEGTPWGASLVALAATAGDRDQKKRYNDSSKLLNRFLKSFEALQTVRGNGGQVLNPTDADFVKTNRRKLEGLKDLLVELRDRYGDTPAGKLGARISSAMFLG